MKKAIAGTLLLFAMFGFCLFNYLHDKTSLSLLGSLVSGTSLGSVILSWIDYLTD